MKYSEYVTVTVKRMFVNMTESSHKKIYLEESDGVSARNLYKICYDGDNICLKSVKKSDRRWQSLFGFFMVRIVLLVISVRGKRTVIYFAHSFVRRLRNKIVISDISFDNSCSFSLFLYIFY